MATTVQYKNSTIAEIEGGSTGALSCEGKTMGSDVIVIFENSGEIRYGDSVTAVSAGDTARLACSGKKMKYDVSVVVDDVTDSIVGTWELSSSISDYRLNTSLSSNSSFRLGGSFMCGTYSGDVYTQTEMELHTFAFYHPATTDDPYGKLVIFAPQYTATTGKNLSPQVVHKRGGYMVRYRQETTVWYKGAAEMRSKRYTAYGDRKPFLKVTITDDIQARQKENFPLLVAWLKANATKLS